MKTKDKFIFIIVVLLLFIVDIGSKKYVFDHFSVVITNEQPENMRILYNKQKPYVYVKPSYEAWELLKSNYTFTFEGKHKAELYDQKAGHTINKIFSKSGYNLGDDARIISKGNKNWLLHDWQNGKRFFIEQKEDTFHVSSSFFSFQVVMNRGAIWGILQGQTIILTIFSVVAISFILFVVFRDDKSKPYLFPLACITSGAFGNLWDRTFFNGVRDFIDFNLGFMQWPTFNLADVFIVVGVISYCLIEIYIGLKTQKREDA